MIVMKFGGTSVEDATAIDRSCGIVAERKARSPFVVVSALAGTTNGLLEAARHAAERNLDQAFSIIATLERRHTALLPETANDFTRLRSLLQEIANRAELSSQLCDMAASYGEILSSRIFADRMRKRGHKTVHVDAREIMITDNNFGKAAPREALVVERFRRHVLPHLDAGAVVVMGGFIGSTESGETTTLGRGASDYTAAIAGAAMNVEEIQIWTDVDGMMTTDPRIVADAWKVKDISFAEASELAYFGAKVLFPLSVLPAVEKNIPVLILNSRKPAGSGTRITREAQPCANPIKSIAVKRGITAVTVTSSRMLMAYGFLRALFEVFDRHRTPVDMVATSEVSVSLTLDDTGALESIVKDLTAFGEVTVDHNLTLICLVGNHLKYTPGIGSRVFTSIRDINVLMVSHGASKINMSFLVAADDANLAVRKLHTEFFQTFDPAVFEPPGPEAFKLKRILRILKILMWAAVMVLFVAAGGIIWILLSGGLSARDTPSRLEALIAPRLRGLAIPRAARDAKNPIPSSPAVLEEAMEHFADHCASCHANDGSGNTGIGRNMFPKAPDMRMEQTQHLTDGELFYIIHNGVRFTGMPAFGGGRAVNDDEASWKLVYFIRRLPSITIEELERMKELNPKTPADRQEEEALQRFLRGEDVAPASAGHTSHH